MTTPQKPLPKVPPFSRKKDPSDVKSGVDMRGMLSIVTMLVSLAALTVSMLAARKSRLRYF